MSCETLSSSIQNAVKRCRTLSRDNDFSTTLSSFFMICIENCKYFTISRQRCRESREISTTLSKNRKDMQISMQIIKNDDNVAKKSLSRDNVRQRLTAFFIELDNVSQLI